MGIPVDLSEVVNKLAPLAERLARNRATTGVWATVAAWLGVELGRAVFGFLGNCSATDAVPRPSATLSAEQL